MSSWRRGLRVPPQGMSLPWGSGLTWLGAFVHGPVVHLVEELGAVVVHVNDVDVQVDGVLHLVAVHVWHVLRLEESNTCSQGRQLPPAGMRLTEKQPDLKQISRNLQPWGGATEQFRDPSRRSLGSVGWAWDMSRVPGPSHLWKWEVSWEGETGRWELEADLRVTLMSIPAPLMLRTHVYLEQLQKGHVC